MQILVNDYPQLIDSTVAELLGLASGEGVRWLSPLRGEDYAEYRDQEFLKRLDVKLEKMGLGMFWPARGPRWDGLARTDRGDLLLVEAKAHIPEMVSKPTGARGKSLRKTEQTLDEAKRFYGKRSGGDWARCFYQHANRLAHLYLLRELNGLPAYLLLIYFVGEREMQGPATEDEWWGAIRLRDAFLGVRERKLAGSVLHAFIDVRDLELADG
jgi:hypothetical protein